MQGSWDAFCDLFYYYDLFLHVNTETVIFLSKSMTIFYVENYSTLVNTIALIKISGLRSLGDLFPVKKRL